MSSRRRPNVVEPATDRPEPSIASYSFRDQVGHLLRLNQQRHLAIFQQHSADPQLTAIQFATLCALRDLGPSSQSDLVKATAIDQATIRGISDRLEKRGLIALSQDEVDKRKVILSLTKAGTALLVLMIPRAREITELTLAPLNPAERIAMLYLLKKMNGGLPEG